MNDQYVIESPSHTTALAWSYASHQEDFMYFKIEGVHFPQSMNLFSFSEGVINQVCPCLQESESWGTKNMEEVNEDVSNDSWSHMDHIFSHILEAQCRYYFNQNVDEPIVNLE